MDQQNKALTISIAAYNMEKYLGAALESLNNARNSDLLDVIIVNDGSKDATLAIAKRYADARRSVFTVIDKENAGYGSTINASIPIARGKYYCLLDADDWMNTPELEKLIDYLCIASEDAVVTKYAEVYEGSDEIKAISYPIDHDGVVRRFSELNPGPMINMHMLALRTDVLRRANIYITEHCYYTDAEYLLKPIPYVDTLSFQRFDVYRYRRGRDEQSVSVRSWQKNIEMGVTVTNGLIEEYNRIVSVGGVDACKLEYIRDKINKSISNKYAVYLTFFPSKSVFNRIQSFDSFVLKANPRLYKESMRYGRRDVVLLRKSHLRPYPAIALFVHLYFKIRGRI